MAARDSYLTRFIKGLINVVTGGAGVVDDQLKDAARRDERERRDAGSLSATRRAEAVDAATTRAQSGHTATIEIDPPARSALRISYAPERDGDPDAGEIVCFFQPATKFKARYNTFGFEAAAQLDDGDMWQTAFALVKLSPSDEKTLATLVTKAAG